LLIDAEGKKQGAVSIDQALYLAYEAELDLVLVNSSSKPPVAKIIDYGKYRYAQEKLESKQKSKSKGPQLKEIRLSLKIDEHDLDVKTKQAIRFIAEGDKIKLGIKLIGREMMFQNKIRALVEDFCQRANAQVESPIERMGNRFSVIIVGKKDNNKSL
jgi:translation initiation factor IF-3